jgi:hypothetical protein
MNLKSYFKSKTKKKTNKNKEHSNSSLMNNSTLYLYTIVCGELQRYKKFTRRRVLYGGAKIKVEGDETPKKKGTKASRLEAIVRQNLILFFGF